MLDRLRLFLDRPLDDGERRRLFAIAVAVMVGAAAVLAVLDDAGSAPPERARATAAPSSTPDAPSEEGRPAVQARASDIAAAKQAARRFLAGYLPFTYGRGHASRLRATTPELRAELARRGPRVPASERRRRPRLELLQIDGAGRERAELLALVRDGARRYSVHLELTSLPSGWLVTGIGS